MRYIIAFLTVYSLTTLPAFPGQTSESPKSPITKEALREALERSVRGGPVVSDVAINGEDLMALLEGGTPIRVKNCVIEGGLVFRKKHATVPITLIDCSLKPAPENIRALWGGHSIYARDVRFSQKVDFSSTTSTGRADFTNAEFEKQANFSRSLFRGSAGFSGTTFRGYALFSNAFLENAVFRNASFLDRAAFGRSRFETAAKFDGAVFEKSANFGKATFRQPQTFAATFNGSAHFKETRFEGDVVFAQAANFVANVSFENAGFGGNARFGEVTFPARADFQGAAFEKSAGFPRSNFGGRANFNEAVFHDGGDFAAARFMGNTSFQSANFLGESDFSDSRFAKEVWFVNARFRALVFFSSMEAERFASFRGAVFDGETSLESAVFGDSADFQGTTFRDQLTFTNTNLGAYADFRDAKIERLELYSVHNPTILRSKIDLRGAWIHEAHIQDVIFENTVDFSDATFGFPLPTEGPPTEQRYQTGSTIFRFVTFNNDVSFARAQFGGQVALENVKFRGIADFTDASFEDVTRGGAPSFAVSYVDFGDLRIGWAQLPEPRYWVQSPSEAIRGSIKAAAAPGPPEPISRTLTKLEKHFRDGNRLEDANLAYYQRKVAELEEARSQGWDTKRLFLELEWLFWGLLCGYGTKIGGAVTSAAFLDLVFALIYWQWATVKREPHPGAQKEHSFRLRLLDFPKQFSTDPAVMSIESPRLRKFIDSLRVSSVILFKIGYRDTTVSGSLGRLPMAYVIAFEWLLGFYLLAAITVTLANTQPLVNRLVTGVF